MSSQTVGPFSASTTEYRVGTAVTGQDGPDVSGAIGTLDLVVSPSKSFQKILPLNTPNSIEVVIVEMEN